MCSSDLAIVQPCLGIGIAPDEGGIAGVVVADGGGVQVAKERVVHAHSLGGMATRDLLHALLHIRPNLVAVQAEEQTRDGRPFNARHLFLTSIRTTPDALLRLVRNRWSIEGWHWIRDTQRHEDAHRYRGNGAGVLGSLRTVALNLLRLEGFQSIRAGMQKMSHDITAMLGMARREPQPTHG